jgi:hypothetical protein
MTAKLNGLMNRRRNYSAAEEVAKLQATVDQYKAEIKWHTEEVADLNAKLQCRTEQVVKLQARLNFLSQLFDNKNEDGLTRTHVSIVVQDRKDEMLHAHKFILVSFLSILRVYESIADIDRLLKLFQSQWMLRPTTFPFLTTVLESY